MEISVTVPANVIHCLLHFAAQKDVRYYLNGIYIRIGQHATHLVASDGSKLGAYRVRYSQPGPQDVVEAIAPRELFRTVPSKGDVVLRVTPGSPTRIAIEYHGKLQGVPAIDGRYPDWRKIMPRSVSGAPAQWLPQNLALVLKASECLKKRYKKGYLTTCRIGHNGQDAAILDFGDPDFTGVIMPLRDDSSPKTLPAWVEELGA